MKQTAGSISTLYYLCTVVDMLFKYLSLLLSKAVVCNCKYQCLRCWGVIRLFTLLVHLHSKCNFCQHDLRSQHMSEFQYFFLKIDSINQHKVATSYSSSEDYDYLLNHVMMSSKTEAIAAQNVFLK